MKRDIEYRLTKDRNDKPLIEIASSLGNDQEFYPDDLRAVAYQLLEIADQADDQQFGKGWRPKYSTVSVDGIDIKKLELQSMIIFAEKTGQSQQAIDLLKEDLEQLERKG